MIRARFQQKLHGKRYKKGDPYEGMTEDQENEAVYLGLGYFEAKQTEPRLTMSNTKEEIQAYLDQKGIEYSDESKQELLDLIQ